MIFSVLATKSRASDSVETVYFSGVPSYECHENPAVLSQITCYGFGKDADGFCSSYTGIYDTRVRLHVSFCYLISGLHKISLA